MKSLTIKQNIEKEKRKMRIETLGEDVKEKEYDHLPT